MDHGPRRSPLLLAATSRHERHRAGRSDGSDRLTFYARTCGWTLARTHARSGDPVAIATYLGNSDAFDQSITDFSARYADQNEQDFEAFVAAAIQAGRLEAVQGL